MSDSNVNSPTDVQPQIPEALSREASHTQEVILPAAETEAAQEESFSDAFLAFQKAHPARKVEDGPQIHGTVVAINGESVFVDIGFKSEGILPLTALPAGREPVRAGDALIVSVKGRDADGYYELSLFRTAQPKDWTSLEKAFADKSTITGNVTAMVKGGLHVDVGVRAFLPASRSGTRDAAEMEKLVGQEIRCRITKLEVAEEDVVIDRRAVLEEEALETKGRRFAEISEGAVIDGTVRSLADYGAFVDLGGIDGLLHVSDLSWTRLSKASDVLEVGQPLQVKVLKIDPETRRISLGLKQLQEHPWTAVADKFAAGDRVRGTVTRTADFGAFVELAPGVEGLVHLSEMSWSKRIHKATEVMNVGDVVEAVILSINLEERRISLGLKQALGDPWDTAAQRLTVGSVVEGPVASITKFGAFVQVAEGIQGLVHISEITPERRLNHPSDVLRMGEVVRAQVLDVDREKRQLKLSMKQLVPTGLDEFLAEHSVGDSVTGRVMSIAENNALVELGEGIVARSSLPQAASDLEPAPATEQSQSGAVDLSAFSSMLSSKWKAGSAPSASSGKKAEPGTEPLAAGQVRSFVITALTPDTKQIELKLA